MFPEQWGHPALVGRGDEDLDGVGVVDEILDHQGVDVDGPGILKSARELERLQVRSVSAAASWGFGRVNRSGIQSRIIVP